MPPCSAPKCTPWPAPCNCVHLPALPLSSCHLQKLQLSNDIQTHTSIFLSQVHSLCTPGSSPHCPSSQLLLFNNHPLCALGRGASLHPSHYFFRKFLGEGIPKSCHLSAPGSTTLLTVLPLWVVAYTWNMEHMSTARTPSCCTLMMFNYVATCLFHFPLTSPSCKIYLQPQRQVPSWILSFLH
jgi:hypothetical protein